MWSLLLPPGCPACGRAGPAPCPACWLRLRPAPPPPAPPAGVDWLRSLLLYDGAGRLLVSRLKYANARGALDWLAEAMAGLAAPVRPDLVTWAPTGADRRRRRGFDQARLLARTVSRHLGVPLLGVLHRRPGPAQTGLGRAERLAGPSFTPRRALAAGARVLVVDDVVTTGATAAAAAAALRAAGAGHVAVVSAAATALKVARPAADA